ncbi:MAG TPA: bifunctional UDP-N-acetylglucosamine diphosphorylase/glucosamine-1-phosphate N-acetyltransferase GlmU [Actinobacteria bacterium]|nr:bifunctional UDP-N-acetylglucosamine diphosphorylase/glucosamine-1-phosphate N-acetyltransferase GlmU [Actinomycetota bacterium]
MTQASNTAAVQPVAVVVLAAGEGTRMRSSLPKVLHAVAGRTLLSHVVHAAHGLRPERLIAVVGHGRELVTEHLTATDPDAIAVVQEQQNGTGHAVRLALSAIDAAEGVVVVLSGDSPLVTQETLLTLIAEHAMQGNAATVLSAVVDDPTGYGRIVRDSSGQVDQVVEHKDATDEQLDITEVNSGMYAFSLEPLRGALEQLTTSNAQGEEYLTDVVALMRRAGLSVGAIAARGAEEILGVNDRAQLADAARVLRDRRNTAAMLSGVTIVDPSTTWIDVDADIATDAVIYPQTQILGASSVAAGAQIGPCTTLLDTEVAADAQIRYAVCELAVIGEQASVGPYTYLRPGTVLSRGARAGGFVEIKNSTVGEDSKVPHLSYVGDAQIGTGTNIGAATVFVNYDGQDKHRTVIGDHVRIGSDTMLVAPVEVGDGAYTAAGSVITDDVPPGSMAVARARQRIIEGWVRLRRPGSASAQAAEAATEGGEESAK